MTTIRSGLQPPTRRGQRGGHREDGAADDLIDADRRQIPAPQLAAKGGTRSGLCWALDLGHVARLYHDSLGPDARRAARVRGPNSSDDRKNSRLSSSRGTSCPRAHVRCPRGITPTRAVQGGARRPVRPMWFYAGRSEEVSAPGQYFVRELNGHNIVVTRNPTGRVRAFHNICRHRGTRICTEATGQFAGSIQCPYHAWTYDLDGRLIGAPHMDEVPHFRKADYPLHERPRRRVGRPRLPESERAALSRSTRSSGRWSKSSATGACRTCGSAAASSTT